MTSRSTWILALTLSLTGTPPAASGSTIAGLVAAQDGGPTAGARVAVHAPEGMRDERRRLAAGLERVALDAAVTGADGAFRLKVPSERIIDLVILHPESAPYSVTLYSGRDLGTLFLSLAPRREGRVTIGGDPAPGARVIWMDRQGRPLWDRTTDADGRYQVPDPARWASSVTVLHPAAAVLRVGRVGGVEGWYGHIQRTQLRPLEVDVELEPGVERQGRVQGADGAGVGGAEIVVDGWPVTTSRPDGGFSVRLAASADSIEVRAGARAAFERPPGEELIFKVGPPRTFKAEVIDRDSGRPVAGASLVATTDRWKVDRMVTDARGRVEVPAWPGEKLSVMVREPGQEAGTGPRELTWRREVLETRFEIARTRFVTGRVVDESGAGIGGAFVSLAEPGEPIYYGRPLHDQTLVTTAPDGRFSLPLATVPKPGLRLKATGRGLALALSKPLGPRQALREEVEIRAPPAMEVWVRVLGEDGRGLADAPIAIAQGNVSLAQLQQAAHFDGGFKWHYQSDASGSARVALRPGRHQLAARVPGHAPGGLAGVAVEPAMAQPLEIVLPRAASLAGWVVDERDEPIAGVSLSLESNGGWIATGPDGAFRFADLLAGPHQIHVRSNELVPEPPIRVEAPDRDLVLRLSRGETLEGRVFDRATLAPIAGASIEVKPVGTNAPVASRRWATSSADGTFKAIGLVPGQVEVSANAQGYVPGQPAEWTVEAGVGARGVELELERGATVRGRVLDTRGEPVERARISARAAGADPSARGPSASTSSEGRFKLAGLRDGDYELKFQAQGYLPATRRLRADRDQAPEELEVVLDAGLELRGDVRDGGGKPLVGVRLSAAFEAAVDTEPPPAEIATATSGDEGAFRLTGLAAGTWTVEARLTGYQSQRVEGVEPARDHRVDVVLRRLPTGSVAGQVLAPETVTSTWLSVSGAQGRAGKGTPVDGRFRIDDVPVGDVTVELYATSRDGSRKVHKSAVVAENRETRVDFDLRSSIEIAGTIELGEAPLMSASVEFAEIVSGSQADALSDADGWYRVEVEPGIHRITVDRPDGTRDLRTLELRHARRLDLDVTGGTLSGRVLDASTEGPVPEALVELMPAKRRDGTQPRLPSTRTDGAGRYRLVRAPTGPHLIRVSHADYARRIVEVDLESGQARRMDLTLEPTAGLRVTLADAFSAEPLGGPMVVRDGRDAIIWDGNVSRDGTRLPLPPGDYRVSVSAGGYASRTVTARVPSEELVIPLTPGGSVRVLSGTLTRRVVRLIDTTGEEYVRCWCNQISAFRVEGSETLIRHVAPGVYTFVVEESDGASSAYPLEVHEGGETELAVR